MFLAHLPAGYILTKFLQKKLHTNRFLWVGLVASILPDIDLVYFYLFDHRQTLHHSYWIHAPFYWLILGLLTLIVIRLSKQRAYLAAAIIFFANIFLHLLLDTIVGKIEWLYPISPQAFYLFDVPAKYDFWVYNFIFHWTFLLEMAVIIWALYLLFKNYIIKKTS